MRQLLPVLLIMVTPSGVEVAADSVACKFSEQGTSVMMGCTVGDVVVDPVTVGLAPGGRFGAWELFSPGAYPGYAPSKPSEGKDGIAVLLMRNAKGIFWRATASLASGQTTIEEGQF